MTSPNASNELAEKTVDKEIDKAIDKELNKAIEKNIITAEIYGLFASLFRSAPTQELLNWLAELDVNADENSMEGAWFNLKQAATQANVEKIEDEFYALFIGIGRGEVMQFASWHIAGTLMEKPLVAIRQDLKRLGFERQEGVKEPEDSIAALLEVMSILQSEPFEAQQDFFNSHIKTWINAFCDQVEQAESAQFYLVVSQVLRQFCLIEQTRFTQK